MIASRIRAAAGRSEASCSEAERPLRTFLAEAPSAAARWRVAVLEDRAEGGWPHTHGDVVCLPRKTVRKLLTAGRRESDEVVETLVHEWVHVVQRARPDLARAVVVDAWGMTPRPLADVVKNSQSVAHRVRSNPDLDGNVYARPGTDLATVSLFPSEAAAERGGLAAAVVRSVDAESGMEVMDESSRVFSKGAPWLGYEHPYEAMAYKVASFAFQNPV